jgi:hypothetical protein
MCIGDFNEIVDQHEKVGGALRRDGQMEQFRPISEYCGLSDLGFKGPKFTWSNGHQDEFVIKERLDRAVANHAWCELFMRREILVLPARTLDHSPLMVRIFYEH